MNAILFSASLAAILVISITITPAFAASANLKISSASGFSLTVKGGQPGAVQENHDIVVYAFFTNTPGVTADSFVAYVIATHKSFNDDPEQDANIKALHAHKLEVNTSTLCVQDLDEAPDVSLNGSTMSIPAATGIIVPM
ncbi:MAG: hypothetical protein ACT4N5_06790 [Nitrosopumilaceae archaeon]